MAIVFVHVALTQERKAVRSKRTAIETSAHPAYTTSSAVSTYFQILPCDTTWVRYALECDAVRVSAYLSRQPAYRSPIDYTLSVNPSW